MVWAGALRLDIFEQDEVVERHGALAEAMADAIAHFREHPHVGEVRQRGMILAIELVRDKAAREPYPWQERRGLRVYRHALSRGVLLCPLGNVVYLMPPYVITAEKIARVAEAAWEGIQLATRD